MAEIAEDGFIGKFVWIAHSDVTAPTNMAGWRARAKSEIR